MAQSDRQSLLQTYKAALPATGVMTLANLPKGYVDEGTGQRVARKLGIKLKSSSGGRAMGRAVGTAGGLATMPLFLSGMRDLKSGDPSRKKKGTAKLMVASAGYGAGKGGYEAYSAFKEGVGNKAALWKLVKRVAGTRGVLSMGAGALTARQIAKGHSKGKNSPVRAAAIGGGLGVVKGMLEAPAELDGWKSFRGKARSKAMRTMVARGAGRGMSGILSGLAIDQIAKRVLK